MLQHVMCEFQEDPHSKSTVLIQSQDARTSVSERGGLDDQNLGQALFGQL